MTGIRLGALAIAGMAICGFLCCAAWGQIPPPDHGAWPDKDAEGRPAPMTFRAFHVPQLLYGRVVEALTAAGCKREESDTFIRFDCEVDPKQWYLTKPGRPEHPGLFVSKGGARMLSEALTLNPQPPSNERREAYAVWLEKLPNRYRPPVGALVDWAAILKDAPLTQAQMRGITYERMITALSAATDCKREDLDAYTVFDCANSKTRWYLTREGMPAHVTWAMMYPRSYLGGDETGYALGSHARPRPAASGDGRPPSPEETAAREELTDAWIRTLPGQKGWAAPPPPLPFNLAGSPFTEEDLRGGRGPELTYDGVLQKLTGAGCTRKDVGEYLAFSCKGSKLLFVLSAPASPAHAAFMIAEPDPGGQNIQGMSTRWFYNPSKPPTEELQAAQRKWMRGVEYLPLSQLR